MGEARNTLLIKLILAALHSEEKSSFPDVSLSMKQAKNAKKIQSSSAIQNSYKGVCSSVKRRPKSFIPNSWKTGGLFVVVLDITVAKKRCISK